MSTKCPAERQGSLVVTTSPGLRLLAKMRTRCAPAIASELMWPGVPVLACATMRPRRSNSAQARSPASRTTGLKAMRCRALARSSTMPIRLDQRISSSTPSMGSALLCDDAADLVDRGRPAWWNGGGGLALLDDRGAGDGLPGRKRPAVIDRRLGALGPGVNGPRRPGAAGRVGQHGRPIERGERAAGAGAPRH